MTTDQRDFSSVSPSAKTLLMLKGYTNIPYARKAAELMSYPEKYEPDFEGKDFTFCFRVAHMEARYRSLDKLLAEVPAKNILELSSGFSFRGLDMTTREHVHYIDTDLAGIIERKTDLIADIEGEAFTGPGQLEVLPLNALDEQKFQSVVSHFPEGPVVIVNEGLLMYLNTEEKKRLCEIIRKVLAEKGGYWITADIYLKNTPEMNRMQQQDELQRFLDQHNIEENKFESFESAEEFFKSCGLVIDAEAEPDYTRIEAIQHAIKLLPPEILQKAGKAPKIQTTWRLKVG
jgi:O-methyltransferase involved in polyketide biosynthesis